MIFLKTILIFTLILLHQLNISVYDTRDQDGYRSSSYYTEENVESLHKNLKRCHYKSGHTFPCPCSLGMDQVNRKGIRSLPTFLVFNQCPLGRGNGVFYGIDRVEIKTKERGEIGLAVYSARRDICGGEGKECYCTCFHQDAVEGSVGFKTSISINDNSLEGYVTDCLGLCGPHCLQGGNDDNRGHRYASILIHDICQSFIRSDEPMPNINECSDEGYRSIPAAVVSLITNGYCPFTI